ncbi:MAG: FAD:protein FMN transferase [Pseudomonadota bacterium]
MELIPIKQAFIKHTPRRRHAPVALLAVFSLILAAPAMAEWVGTTESLMGTRITVRLYHPQKETGEAAVRAAINEIARIERLMSTYMDDSRISAINREAHLQPVAAGSELFALLRKSLEVSRLTDGSFDMTYDSVGQHYDFREGKRPDAEVIADALPKINYELVKLDILEETVQFAREGVRINLGGIAKGYAVKRAVDVLRELGVQYASVSAGGDSQLLGDRRGQPWLIGIQDPRNREGLAVRLPLADEAVSTSGDYERYFIEGDTRHHHIISPDTGRSAREVQSVTIVGPDATMTDALSTSVFVMGVERGLALIERMDGFDAIVIDANRKMHYSSGFNDADQG